jgi:hypothetical protein
MSARLTTRSTVTEWSTSPFGIGTAWEPSGEFRPAGYL